MNPQQMLDGLDRAGVKASIGGTLTTFTSWYVQNLPQINSVVAHITGILGLLSGVLTLLLLLRQWWRRNAPPPPPMK